MSAQQQCGALGAEIKPDNELKMRTALARIRHKVVVLSGKGGVGKSTVAASLAVGLALSGKRTGLLDVDVHGPSIPRLLRLTGSRPGMSEIGMVPVEWNWNLKVMSIGFLLPDQDSPVIWRGPVKGGVIKQFIQDVDWGDLDFLVVDCPPGTGDEPLSVLQFLGPEAQALVVTSPQAVAVDDVRRSVSFCRMLGNPVLGVVENLSGFTCPGCGQTHPIFAQGGGERLAAETGVPFLGHIPIEPRVSEGGDAGEAFLGIKGDSPAAKAFGAVVQAVLDLDQGQAANPPA
jgi:ATP-binding protein involved in chromosome partitioning